MQSDSDGRRQSVSEESQQTMCGRSRHTMTSARFLLRITPLLLLLPAVLGAAIKDNQNSDNEEEREEFVGNSLFKREPSPSYTDTIIAVIEAARRQVESVERRRNDLYDEFQRLSFDDDDDDDDDDEDETDAVDGESSIVNLAERMVDLETGDVFLRSVEEKKKQQQQQEKKNDEKIDETKIETIITQVNKQRKTLKKLESLVCEMMAQLCAKNKLKCRKCPFTSPTTGEPAPVTTPNPPPETTIAKKPDTTKETPQGNETVTPQEVPTTTTTTTTTEGPKKTTTTKAKPTLTTAKPQTTTTTAKKPDPKGDCGTPDSPSNGHTDHKNTTLNHEAVIICHSGYDLIGNKRMQCTAIWNAQQKEFDYSWAPPLSVICKPNGKPVNPVTKKPTPKPKPTPKKTPKPKAATTPAPKVTKAPAPKEKTPAKKGDKKKAKKELNEFGDVKKEWKKELKGDKIEVKAIINELIEMEDLREERARSFVDEEASLDHLVAEDVDHLAKQDGIRVAVDLGDSDDADEDVEKRHSNYRPYDYNYQIPSRCLVERSVASCCNKHAYYYDYYEKICKGFYPQYINENSFEYKDECEQTCMRKMSDWYGS